MTPSAAIAGVDDIGVVLTCLGQPLTGMPEAALSR